MNRIEKISTSLIAFLAFSGCSFSTSSNYNGNYKSNRICIGTKSFEKTAERTIIPKGKTATVEMQNDSSYAFAENKYDGQQTGAFIKNRKVTLGAYALGQYEVTQELYEAVMGQNPSKFNSVFILASTANEQEKKENANLRPVDSLSYLKAAAFCNELTRKTMGSSSRAFFCDKELTVPYTKEDAVNHVIPYVDISKKGYRLPTEAEWEFAARGADPSGRYWNYAYGTVTVENGKTVATDQNLTEALSEIAWYYDSNPNRIIHETGLKKPNALNLYDLLGNVEEWCCDWYEETLSTEEVVNPCGPESGTVKVLKGGAYDFRQKDMTVSLRITCDPQSGWSRLGMRLCRTL